MHQTRPYQSRSSKKPFRWAQWTGTPSTLEGRASRLSPRPVDISILARVLREEKGDPRARKKKLVTCQTAFQRVARLCLDLVRKHRVAACRGDAEAGHQIRIGLTRLRAARKFLAAIARDVAWPKLKRDILWFISALGNARDRDVATRLANGKLGNDVAAGDARRLAGKTQQAHRRLASVLRPDPSSSCRDR